MSSRSEWIYEIHQLWKSDFKKVYSNSYCSRSFEPEIMTIGQSSHKMYSNNILNFQESTTKKSGNLLNAPRTHTHIFILSSWTPLNLNIVTLTLLCIDFLTPPTPLIIPHRLPAFLESRMPLKNWCCIHARWSKSSLKHPYVSVAFFPS